MREFVYSYGGLLQLIKIDTKMYIIARGTKEYYEYSTFLLQFPRYTL